MKRILPILFILFIALYSQGQTRTGSLTDAGFVHSYPNPATSYIIFDLQKGYDKGYTLQVYSFMGKKMYEITNVNQHNTLNLTDFNRGVYIYQLRDPSGKVIESGKFQVSK